MDGTGDESVPIVEDLTGGELRDLISGVDSL
jgi:hypothetical protein